ncbi:MAG: hypothetical protein QW057_02285 [Candidatus Bathyarchaeia archaeon]
MGSRSPGLGAAAARRCPECFGLVIHVPFPERSRDERFSTIPGEQRVSMLEALCERCGLVLGTYDPATGFLYPSMKDGLRNRRAAP